MYESRYVRVLHCVCKCFGEKSVHFFSNNVYDWRDKLNCHLFVLSIVKLLMDIVNEKSDRTCTHFKVELQRFF